MSPDAGHRGPARHSRSRRRSRPGSTRKSADEDPSGGESEEPAQSDCRPGESPFGDGLSRKECSDNGGSGSRRSGNPGSDRSPNRRSGCAGAGCDCPADICANPPADRPADGDAGRDRARFRLRAEARNGL